MRWIIGNTNNLPDEKFDLAVMTGNVAQVFLDDQAWKKALIDIHARLAPSGHFVFETRDPTKEAWRDWTENQTYQNIDIKGVGIVTAWCDLLSVEDELISFRWTYVFKSDGQTITSDSTLRFKSQNEIETSLKATGYKIVDIRDAPDRPGKEFVFIAAPANPPAVDPPYR